jgi:hypothetical protein
MATPTYYLADTTKEWNLKLLKLPTNGEYNLFGDTYSYTDGTNKTNLSLGTAISRNITGSYNLSLGSNVCTALTSGSYNTAVGSSALASITTLSRNLALGYQALSNLTYQATGLSKIILLTGGTYSANVSSGPYIFNITVASGPSPTTMPTATYYYTANTTGQGGFINGNITNVTLINSGSGFSSSTTFTLSTTTSIGTGSPSATYSFVYDDPNSGNDNIAIGYQALNTTQYSVRNIAIGSYALTNLSQTLITRELLDNIALGFNSQFGSVLGVNNISIGNYSLAGNTLSSLYYAPSNIICIGNNAMSNIRTNGSNSICIGNSSMNNTINNSVTTDNICIGNSSMTALNGGYFNLCIGNSSGAALTIGYQNLCIGNNAGRSLTTGNDNTFVGYYAGSKVMSAAYRNVAVGSNVLAGVSGNFTGNNNTFINSAQHANITTASDNFIAGQRTGTQITTGTQNILIGSDAGYSMTDGNYNIGIGGYQALSGCISGNYNVGIGYQAGSLNPGSNNICIGAYSGVFLNYVGTTTASQNVFIGYNAGYGGILSSTFQNRSTNCVAIGTNAGYGLTTGSNNTFIGTVSQTGSVLTTTGSNVTTLGYLAAPTTATVSNQITLGNSSVATLRCQQTAITALSDARDKINIIDLPVGLDFINKVRPVKFTWAMREKNFDENGDEIINPHNGIDNAGFIAQELDEVETSENVDFLHLVLKDNPDKLEASYGKLLPVMVKAIQELSSKVDFLTQELALLKASK